MRQVERGRARGERELPRDPATAERSARKLWRTGAAQQKRETERSGQISIPRLRWFLRLSALVLGSKGALPKHSHLLHALPLLRANDHDYLGNENVVLERAAREKVIACLNIRHGDGLASFAQRGFFVQIDGLRDIIGAQHFDF